ncbi:PQQ-binding-like beta-propeller repeat protein [Paenibacillaceae bacterium WGS1546]|uniref:outer membrane protein assembly factor BamB family protein n=1 Tax=Cohnella sp. WGS1546 TaxID=3366810 RepID=UPI00372D3B42
MTKRSIIWLALALLLVMPAPAFAAASPSLEPVGKQRKLPVKDDQGKNLILHNAQHYRLKWHIADKSPYQHFRAYQDADGAIYFIAFDYVMAVDRNGSIRWKQSLKSELNDIDHVGMDGTFYRLYQGNFEYANESDLIVDQIVRIGRDGKKRIFPPTTAYAPKDENGFPSGYPLYAGDSEGNFLLLTGDGLVSYRPNGSIGWRLNVIADGSEEIDATDVRSLFADDRGRFYVQTSDRLLRLDADGRLEWSHPLSEDAGSFYLDERRILHAWTFDPATMSFTVHEYGIAKDGSLVVLSESAPQLAGVSDRRGGAYELDEKTNAVTRKDKAGKVLWNYSLTKKDIAWGRSLAAFTLRSDEAGNVYFSANVGTVYSLDPNGKPRFIVEMGNRHSYYSDILPISDKLTMIMIDNQILCIEEIES